MSVILAVSGAQLCSAAEDSDSSVVIVSKGSDEASKKLNAWFKAGKAAGLEGVWYDNRDRLHSDLRITSYPQLKPIGYTEEELKVKADWGAQRKLLEGKVVVGNSSTASTVTKGGSHQRIYYVHPNGLNFLYGQYRTNALYVYPEHRDHDPGVNGPDGFGDLYPANSPYLISSQGSSGSDKVFMRAVLKTIAAIPPEIQKLLVQKGLLMPTVQAILRKTYKAADGPDDYFTGKAHPSVFDGKQIDVMAMVNLAQALTSDAIPPLVTLKVVKENGVIPRRDFFEPEVVKSEKIADSPCAIARLFRGPEIRRTMLISAHGSIDHQDRALTFRWVVLRGDPDLITIEPGDEYGGEVTISVAHHPRRPISPGSSMWSNRVDIGVFAEAEGSMVSAPSFVSFTTLPNEHRCYSENDQLLEIFYGARSRELGMPPSTSRRWDVLLSDIEKPEQPARIGLLFAFLENEQIESLRKAASETKAERAKISAAQDRFDAIIAAHKKAIDVAKKNKAESAAAHQKGPTHQSKKALDTANAIYIAATKAMSDGAGGATESKKNIADLQSTIAARIRENSAPDIVRSALDAIRSESRFFSINEVVIGKAVEESSNPKARNALTSALQRLEFVGISESDHPPLNELYHLEQRNLDILSEILFPDFLNRPIGPLYSDPRLTASKDWRDVYDYDEKGERIGWTRYRDGKSADYTADGEKIRSRKKDGSPDEVVKVSYVFDPKARRLKIVEE